jgi:hypothetical protein
MSPLPLSLFSRAYDSRISGDRSSEEQGHGTDANVASIVVAGCVSECTRELKSLHRARVSAIAEKRRSSSSICDFVCDCLQSGAWRVDRVKGSTPTAIADRGRRAKCAALLCSEQQRRHEGVRHPRFLSRQTNADFGRRREEARGVGPPSLSGQSDLAQEISPAVSSHFWWSRRAWLSPPVAALTRESPQCDRNGSHRVRHQLSKLVQAKRGSRANAQDTEGPSRAFVDGP